MDASCALSLVLRNLRVHHRVKNKWTVLRMLGCGSFVVVYKVCDDEGYLYALKTEKYTPKNALKVEVKVLQTGEKQKLKYFLKLLDCGTCKSPEAGSSVDALRRLRPDRRFTLPCAVTLGIHFVDAIEELHNMGYQHRDIKAANVAIGAVERQQIYIIDFGLCRSFFDEFGSMRRPRKVAPFRGTVRYAPLACHILRETCRKDHLESWLYSQIEYTRASLPWRDLNNIIDVGLYKERCRHDIGLGELMGECPREYINILRYLDSLTFYEKPDYEKCRRRLKAAGMVLGGYKPTYDWIDENLRAGNGNVDTSAAPKVA
ncbi:hypothetical protein QR680_002928 [Steinernema hermaphroditum]|uniref:Protein kinase domain-containing protein n=1 Tax=Steinernema hermaphroditum TaxID=289476 RepID=A0AA39H4N2_9BILA|nr:hypothetical protein QR680_002928 [Steinernema hermaphroditum]